MPGNYVGGGRMVLVGDGFWSGLGGILKGAAKVAGGAILGGPVGAIVGGIQAVAGAAKKTQAQPTAENIARFEAVAQSPLTTAQLPAVIPKVMLPAIAAGGAAIGGAATRILGKATASRAGTIAKIVAGGTAAAGIGTLIEQGLPSFGGKRRYRRMNPLNPKALKRATRRLAGFHAFAQSTSVELRKLAPASSRRCAPPKGKCSCR